MPARTRCTLPLALALLGQGAAAAVFVPGVQPDPPTGEAPGAEAGAAPAAAQQPSRGGAFRWRLGPWRQSGLAALDSRWLRTDDGRISRQWLLMGESDWGSYLWQPWFMQLRLGLGLLAAHDTSRGGANGDASVHRSQALTGRLGVSLFPSSRFPMELRADVADSRTGGEALGTDTRAKRLSLSQAFRPDEGNASLQFNLDHSRLDSQGARDVLTTVQLNGQQQSGAHDLEASLSRSSNQRSDTAESADLSAASLRHGFHPSSALQVDTLVNWNVQRLQQAAPGGGAPESAGIDLRQLSTVLSWRPHPGQWLHDPKRPLQVAGSLRWVESVMPGEAMPTLGTLNGTLGASLELSPEWRAGAVFAAGISRGGDAAPVRSRNLAGSLGWTPAGRNFDAWRYAPSASLGLGAAQVGEGTLQRQIGIQGMHAVSREWRLDEESSLSLSLSQSLGLQRQTRLAVPLRTLNHGLGLYWQAVGDGSRQQMLGLSVNDARSRSEGSGSFQLVNLQWSQRTVATRFTSWSVNATVQATRNSNDEVDPATALHTRTGSGWQRYYSGAATLEQQRLFGVPRLRHQLQLTVNSQQFERRAAGDIDAPRERISHLLESRVDYAIGRLDLRLVARWAVVDGRDLATLQARLQRRF